MPDQGSLTAALSSAGESQARNFRPKSTLEPLTRQERPCGRPAIEGALAKHFTAVAQDSEAMISTQYRRRVWKSSQPISVLITIVPLSCSPCCPGTAPLSLAANRRALDIDASQEHCRPNVSTKSLIQSTVSAPGKDEALVSVAVGGPFGNSVYLYDTFSIIVSHTKHPHQTLL